MVSSEHAGSVGPARFAHEALLYSDDDEYLAGTVPFIEAGLAGGEAVMVSVPAVRLDLIRRQLDDAADDVMLVPMERIGRNPARIIPAWVEFVTPFVTEGRAARGIGEPVWAARSDDEMVECQRHEQLLNLALGHADGFRLLCPYDTASLRPDVLDGARRNHPHLDAGWGPTPNPHFDPAISTPMTDPLPEVPAWAEESSFDAQDLFTVREHVARTAAARGLSGDRLDAFEVSVSEALANSVSHGGGRGELSLWCDGARILCEIRDRGIILDPLAGRVRPGLDQDGGRGLWLMNQLCDLVQIRRRTDGAQVVRLHMSV